MLTQGYAPPSSMGSTPGLGFPATSMPSGNALPSAHWRDPIQATDRASGVELPALKAINPKVSRNVSDAVMWALEMRVEKRPQTIRDFLIAMRGDSAPLPDSTKRTHNGIDQGRNGAADCPGNGMGRGQGASLRVLFRSIVQ